MTDREFRIDRRTFLGGAAAACVASPVSAQQAAPAKRLAVSWWGSVDRARKFDTIFAAWAALRPNVNIVPSYATWGAYWERFATQSLAGNLPDVIGMTERQVKAYDDLLVDLGPWVAQGKLDLKAYDKIFVDAGMVNGKLKMICTGATIPSLIYNSAHLQTAGVEPPGNWSLDEFKNAAIKLANARTGAQWGVSDDGGDALVFDTFLRQGNARLFTADGLGFEVEHWVEWLSFWAEMRRTGACPPPAVTAEVQGVPQQDTLIARGRVSIFLQNHNQILTFQRYVKDDLVPAMIPVRSGGKPVALLAGTYWSMPRTTKEPELAVEFLNFFVNNDDAIKGYSAELGLVPSAYGRKVLEGHLDPVNARLQAFGNAVLPHGSVSLTRHPGALQAEGLVRRANEAVALGGVPREVARRFHAQARSMMV